MQFSQVCIESLGYELPDEIIDSDEIEKRLHPLYGRLKLPEGRLELMTGIRERRVWPVGTLPSDISIKSAKHAIAASGVDQSEIGALVHASVCRDHLEPATACRVHHELDLSSNCVIYDLSNACLGLMNGAVQIATMIEIGQIKAGIVVGTEDSRHLLESTVLSLNEDHSLTRASIKNAIASLTIGSASCAILLTHESLSNSENRLVAASIRTNTEFHELCRSGKDETVGGGMHPLMQTDSENLMRHGIATGIETFDDFLRESRWTRDCIDKTICHQVGTAHRRLMLESLELNPESDFISVKWLGNTGSAALPTTLALASSHGFLNANDRVALLGIGSGINCIMMGVHWQSNVVCGSGTIPKADSTTSTSTM